MTQKIFYISDLFFTARFYRAVFFAFIDALCSVILLLLLGAMISGAQAASTKANLLQMILPLSESQPSITTIFWMLVCIKAIAFGGKNYTAKSLSNFVTTQMSQHNLHLPLTESKVKLTTVRDFIAKGVVVVLADGLFLIIASTALLITEPIIAVSLWIYIALGLILQGLFANSIHQYLEPSARSKPKINRKEKFIRAHHSQLRAWRQMGKELRILHRRRNKLTTIFRKQLITQSIAESTIPLLFFCYMGVVILISKEYWPLDSATQLQCVLLLIYCQSPSRRILRAGRFLKKGWSTLRQPVDSRETTDILVRIQTLSSKDVLTMDDITGADKETLYKMIASDDSSRMEYQTLHSNVAFFSLALELKGETLLSALSMHREETERPQLKEWFEQLHLNETWLNEKTSAKGLSKRNPKEMHRLAFIKCLNSSFDFIIAHQNEIETMNLSINVIEEQLKRQQKKLIIC